MKHRIIIGMLLSAILLSACSSATVRPTVDQRLAAMGLEPGAGNQRIPRYSINGWSSLDDLNLVITSGVNDRYLVTLRAPCLNLSGAFLIGFTTPTGSLDRFEDIVVRQPGRGRETCPINDIIALHPR